MSVSSTSSSSKSKKQRKSPKAWTDEEKARLHAGLELFGRDWQKLAAHMGTRGAPAIRSHCQMYFMKLLKAREPLPAKVKESGSGYTLSGKPLNKYSSSVKRVFSSPSEVPMVEGVCSDQEAADNRRCQKTKDRVDSRSVSTSTPEDGTSKRRKRSKKESKSPRKRGRPRKRPASSDEDDYAPRLGDAVPAAGTEVHLRRSTRDRGMSAAQMSRMRRDQVANDEPFSLRTDIEFYGAHAPPPYSVSYCPNALLLADVHAHLCHDHEIMGLLAGSYDPSTRAAKITRVYPLKEEMSSEQEVTACALSTVEATTRVFEAGLMVLGWYHSHPTFDNYPSNRDLQQHSSHKEEADKMGMPYIGLIIGSWSSSTNVSEYRWFNAEKDECDFVGYEFYASTEAIIPPNDSHLIGEISALIDRYSSDDVLVERANFLQGWVPMGFDEEKSSSDGSSSKMTVTAIPRCDKILHSLHGHMHIPMEIAEAERALVASKTVGTIMALFSKHRDKWWRSK
jgi:protein MYSM1